LPFSTHSTAYVNEIPSNKTLDDDDFYVTPHQEHPPTEKKSNTLPDTSDDESPSTPPPPHHSDTGQFYATPPTFARNFVLESNLSFDDSQDMPAVSLDSVPDLIDGVHPTPNNDAYYSYPEAQVKPVRMSFVFSFQLSIVGNNIPETPVSDRNERKSYHESDECAVTYCTDSCVIFLIARCFSILFVSVHVFVARKDASSSI
jgi:hypothetical protein